MSAQDHDPAISEDAAGTVDVVTEVRREEALLKAGALQNAILNSANFSSIATDEKGVIQLFNVGAERMLGYTAADVLNKITPADISDPQELIARAEALSLELATTITPGFQALAFKASRGIEDIYELTYIRKDGSRFPAIVSVTALRDDQDAIIGYLLIGTDNTARKQAEEALVKAGALQTAIFNSANFSSIATDEKGVIQLFNVGAERMLGYTAADVLNKITPADISDPQEVIARAEALSFELGTTITPGFQALAFKASRGIEDIYELTYIRKDGSRFPAIVSVTALRDDQDAIIGYLLIGTDNSARKQVEEEQKRLDQRLRDQQFYTRSLIESNIDALMTTDPAGIITDVNKQMEALTGCTRDELIGAPFKNYFTDPERAEASIKLVLREKKVSNYELTARARDGKTTVVSYNATTFYDRDRKLQGVCAVARDVTERKRLDQALQEKNVEFERATAAAEKANLAKSDFLSSMSHELRSPLNAILGFAQLINSDSPPPTPSQAASIDQILHAGWYLLELINEILDLAQIESGRLALSLEPTSLDEVMFECQAMIEPQAQKRGIGMTFPQFDSPCFVSATARSRRRGSAESGSLADAIFNSANFSSIATDEKGVIQLFNVGAERMLGYTAADVLNKITPADISDPQELIARAEALSFELGTTITPASRHWPSRLRADRGHLRIDLHRKDGSRFPAIVSVTALRDDQDAIIGYLLIGTDNSAASSRSGTAEARSAPARPAVLHAVSYRIQHRRADDHRSGRHHHRRQQADGASPVARATS